MFYAHFRGGLSASGTYSHVPSFKQGTSSRSEAFSLVVSREFCRNATFSNLNIEERGAHGTFYILLGSTFQHSPQLAKLGGANRHCYPKTPRYKVSAPDTKLETKLINHWRQNTESVWKRLGHGLELQWSQMEFDSSNGKKCYSPVLNVYCKHVSLRRREGWKLRPFQIHYLRSLAFAVMLGGAGSFFAQQGGDFLHIPILHSLQQAVVILVPLIGLQRKKKRCSGGESTSECTFVFWKQCLPFL